MIRKVKTEDLVDELFVEIDRYYAAGKRVMRDERAAAEAEQWLAENEDETAMTPERLAALEAAAARGGDGDASQSDAGHDARHGNAAHSDAGQDVRNGDAAKPRTRLDESQSPVAGRRFTRT